MGADKRGPKMAARFFRFRKFDGARRISNRRRGGGSARPPPPPPPIRSSHSAVPSVALSPARPSLPSVRAFSKFLVQGPQNFNPLFSFPPHHRLADDGAPLLHAELLHVLEEHGVAPGGRGRDRLPTEAKVSGGEKGLVDRPAHHPPVRRPTLILIPHTKPSSTTTWRP